MKYPAGECLTITPFISILNINEFPLGWFPLSPPFSISLCLSFISIALPPLPERQPKTQPSQLYSGTRRANLDDFRKTSACVCNLENANVYARRGSHGVTAATESRPPLFNTKGIIFGAHADWWFLCAPSCCLTAAAEIRAHLQFVAALSFLLMGIHAAPLPDSLDTHTHTRL